MEPFQVFVSDTCSHFKNLANCFKYEVFMLWADFFDQSSLKNHYLPQHNVDENNHFFKKPFSRDRVFVARKCFRCDHFCVNSRDEKTHNFLSHYEQGGRQPVEDKPLKRTFFDENLQRYCIDFSEHGLGYLLCLF